MGMRVADLNDRRLTRRWCCMWVSRGRWHTGGRRRRAAGADTLLETKSEGPIAGIFWPLVISIPVVVFCVWVVLALVVRVYRLYANRDL